MDTTSSSALAATDLSNWLASRVSEILGRPASEIALHHPFSQMQLDSAGLVTLAALISDGLGVAVQPTILFDHPTIDRLAKHLSGQGALVDARQQATAQPISLPCRPFSEATPIAIVGMDCRLPGADGLEAFWQLLSQGDSAIKAMDDKRAAMGGWHPEHQHRFGGFVDQIEDFDPAPFGISPREAAAMDPQQRMLLEASWHALEHAHIPPDSLSGSMTGVFIGIFSNDYFRTQVSQGVSLSAHSGTGGAPSIAANRISYCLGLEGPSMTIDTACSSSLVALHQACQSLARHECNLAISGGANLILSPDLSEIFAKAGMLSPGGQCKTFDASADGYVRGEGCGVLVLKRLDDALRDGDSVLAVIAGSAINQDGASNGLTAPSGLAQQRVVKAALAKAGIKGGDLDYVETHGTGTSLGDPIEVMALRASVDQEVNSQPCWLGALKTQIGHLEAAAGVAGIIKVVLALQHELIPGNRNFERLNPKIDLNGSRLQPAAHAVPWPHTPERVRRAGVSSFGFGGANAHAIVEEAPRIPQAVAQLPSTEPLSCLLSAKTPEALRIMAGQLAQSLKALPPETLATQCAVLAKGRARLESRLAITAQGCEGLIQALSAFSNGDMAPGSALTQTRTAASKRPPLAFLFTGQGAQYAGMGASLYQTDITFRASIDRCSNILQPFIGCRVTDILWGDETDKLADTRYAQPALCALQIALYAAWTYYGVIPDAVCGHSVGEFAAAYAAGIMDLETALYLVAMRGRYMSEATGGGAMLSVAASEQQVQAVLQTLPGIDLAGLNSPRQTVIAGASELIDAAVERLEQAGFSSTRLRVSHAFHSAFMDKAAARFADLMDDVALARPRLPMHCTGGTASQPWEPAYWPRQIREPVRFSAALRQLQDKGVHTFIEVGPGSTLLGLVRDTLQEATGIASLKPNIDASMQFRASLADWWACGGEFNLGRLFMPHGTSGLPRLPGYPFQRKPFWFDPPAPTSTAPGSKALQTGAWPGELLSFAHGAAPILQVHLPGALPSLLAHRFANRAIMPAAGFICLALAAAQAQQRSTRWSAQNFHFERVLELDEPATVQLSLQPGEDGQTQVECHARHEQEASAATWIRHMSAKMAGASSTPALDVAQMLTAQDCSRAPQALPANWYTLWADRGLAYGDEYRLIQQLQTEGAAACATLASGAFLGASQDLSPAWLDAVIQTACVAAHAGTQQDVHDQVGQRHGTRVLVPTHLASLSLDMDRLQDAAKVVAICHEGHQPQSRTALVDIQVLTSSGQPALIATGLTLTLVDTGMDAEQANQPGKTTTLQTSWQTVTAKPTTSLPAGAHPWLVIGASSDAVSSCMQAIDEQAGRSSGLVFNSAGDTLRLMAQLKSPAPNGEAFAGIVIHAPAQDMSAAPEAEADLAIERAGWLQRLLLLINEDSFKWLDKPIVLLTHAACLTSPEDRARPDQAAMAAIMRSAAHEFPQLRLRHVDLEQALPKQGVIALADALTGLDETLVAIRHQHILAPRLRSTRLPLSTVALQDDARYLITGGTGALGMLVAAELIERGAKKLCLVARSLNCTPEAQRQLAIWRAAGCDIQLRACDCARRDEVQALVQALKQDAIPLKGIVHAAGITADTPLANLQDADWRKVIEGKAMGARWLDLATRDMDLAFFLAFSSAVSPLGSPGQCNYGAANAMMEAILHERAHALKGRQTSCQVIQWGPWAGHGMASADTVRNALESRGMLPMPAADGIDALGMLLSSPDHAEGPLLIGAFDWSSAAKAWGSRPQPSFWRDLTVSQTEAASSLAKRITAEALTGLEKGPRLQAIRAALSTLLTDILRIEAKEVHADEASVFDALRPASLGLDSLMAMELRNRVRQWLAIDVPAEMLIGPSVLGDVVQLIDQKLLLKSLSRPAPESSAQSNDDDLEIMVL